MWYFLEFSICFSIVAVTLTLQCVVNWRDRNAAFNIVKHTYFLFIYCMCLVNLTNLAVWLYTLFCSSPMVSKSIGWIRILQLSVTCLLRSTPVGTTIIKIKRNHAWSWTPQLLHSIYFGVLVSWLASTLAFVLSILIDLQAHGQYASTRCKEYHCYLDAYTLLSQCRLAVTVLYMVVILATGTCYYRYYKKSIVIDPALRWTKERIAFFHNHNKMYLVYYPLMLLVLGQQLAAQLALHFDVLPNNAMRNHANGYMMICQATEPLLLSGLYYYFMIYKKMSLTLMNHRKF